MLARHENAYLETIEAAFEREDIARVLWDHLERQPGALQRDIGKELQVTQESALEIVELWEELGIILRRHERNTYRLYLRTRLSAEAEGICQACGTRARACKGLFFKPAACRNCGVEGYYYIDYTVPQWGPV